MKITLWLIGVSLLSRLAMGAAVEMVPTQVPLTVTAEETSRFRISFQPSFFLVSNQNTMTGGPSLGIEGSVGISPKWGVGGTIHQCLTGNFRFSPLFLEANAFVRYALSGSLLKRTLKVSAGDKATLMGEEANIGGFRAQIIISQFAFSSATTLMMTGFGGALAYEFPSTTMGNVGLGLRGSYLLTNFGNSLLAQAYASLGLWL